LTRSILISGCSTGIGWTCALGMRERGWRVFATARKPEDLARLEAQGVEAIYLDYADPASVTACANEVATRSGGRLDALFNNGAFGQPGAVEDLRREVLEQQFACNVFGWHQLTRDCLPLMRANAGGRIVQCSSVLGLVALKWRRAYNASKFALEGFSEALRRELMLFGIDVIIVAPGQVKTPIWGKAEAMDWTGYENTPYARPIKKMLEWVEYGDKSGLPPEAIGAAVAKALTTAHPKSRYVLTPSPVQHFAMNHLPKRWVDRIMARMLGLTKPKP